MKIFIVMFLALGSFFSASAETLNVRWSSSARDAVNVSWTPDSPAVSACLESGFIYSVRYEFEICDLRLLWWDDCTAARVNKRLSRDPISDIISIDSDRLGDTEPPQAHNFSFLKDGLKQIEHEEFPLNLNPSEKNRRVLKTRVSAACRGESRGFFDRLPAILSLGMLSADSALRGEFDSHWTEFSLKE